MGGRGSGSSFSSSSIKSNLKLAKLEGSPKQVAWAEKIRETTIDTITNKLRNYEDIAKTYGGITKEQLTQKRTAVKGIVDTLSKETRSSVFIEGRDNKGVQLNQKMMDNAVGGWDGYEVNYHRL